MGASDGLQEPQAGAQAMAAAVVVEVLVVARMEEVVGALDGLQEPQEGEEVTVAEVEVGAVPMGAAVATD